MPGLLLTNVINKDHYMQFDSEFVTKRESVGVNWPMPENISNHFIVSSRDINCKYTQNPSYDFD